MKSNSTDMALPIERLGREIIACDACPRLRKHCGKMAREKRKAYREQTYWGKPITGFGDPRARLMIVGLAPAAHGANRTGRIFTGDRSGDWLYRALHRAGFANQPHSVHREDGLRLKDVYISCVVKCAPPDNRPTRTEVERCGQLHLKRELQAIPRARVWLALGQIALNGLWPLLSSSLGISPRPKPKFRHASKLELAPGKWLLMSYHPSQQNTFTGRLTEPMWNAIFEQARKIIDPNGSSAGPRRA